MRSLVGAAIPLGAVVRLPREDIEDSDEQNITIKSIENATPTLGQITWWTEELAGPVVIHATTSIRIVSLPDLGS